MELEKNEKMRDLYYKKALLYLTRVKEIREILKSPLDEEAKADEVAEEMLPSVRKMDEISDEILPSVSDMTEETTPQTNADPQDNATAPRAVDWQNPRVAAILSAAATCFARKGFGATTLAEIGKELGLRKSIVHYYFASKAALIHEVQSFTYHKYLDHLKEALQPE